MPFEYEYEYEYRCTEYEYDRPGTANTSERETAGIGKTADSADVCG